MCRTPRPFGSCALQRPRPYQACLPTVWGLRTHLRGPVDSIFATLFLTFTFHKDGDQLTLFVNTTSHFHFLQGGGPVDSDLQLPPWKSTANPQMVQTGRVHPHSGEEQNKKEQSDKNLVLQTFSVVSDTHSVAKLTITVNRRDNDMVYSCEVSYGFHLLPFTYCLLPIAYWHGVWLWGE